MAHKSYNDDFIMKFLHLAVQAGSNAEQMQGIAAARLGVQPVRPHQRVRRRRQPAGQPEGQPGQPGGVSQGEGKRRRRAAYQRRRRAARRTQREAAGMEVDERQDAPRQPGRQAVPQQPGQPARPAENVQAQLLVKQHAPWWIFEIADGDEDVEQQMLRSVSVCCTNKLPLQALQCMSAEQLRDTVKAVSLFYLAGPDWQLEARRRAHQCALRVLQAEAARQAEAASAETDSALS